jgi:signal transduction histidine kinase
MMSASAAVVASYDQLPGVVFSSASVGLSNTVAIPTMGLVWIAAAIVLAFLCLYFVMRSGRRQQAADSSPLATGNGHAPAGPTGAEARARAEELRIILDAVPGMVLIANDPQCKEIVGSRTAYELLRAPYGTNLSKSAPEGEMPTSFRTLQNGVEVAAELLPLQLAATRGAEVRESEMTMVFNDESKRDFLGNAAPFFDHEGKVRGAVGVFVDITERNLTEEALRNAQAELASVSRTVTMGELTATIAHEINQPLAAVVTDVSASLRWLAQNPPNLEEARSAIVAAIREANRASDVVSRIRALVKNVPPPMLRVDLGEMVGEVLSMASRELHAHGIPARVDIDPDAAWVLGDRIQLQQVLLNLIMNSIDAMSSVTSRQKELRIQSSKHRDGVLLQVRDNGDGIDPKQLDRIFEPFFTTKARGVGMGLAISRSIIEAHGGRLWAEPNLPDGSVFQFTLKNREN